MDDITSFVQGFARGDLVVLVVFALLIVAATAVISHVVAKLIMRLTQSDGSPLPSSSILVNIARIAIWTFGISFMLSSCFKVDVNGLLAALGVGGIALSLGMQDTVKNFIGGLQVTLMGIVHPGDHIVVDGVDGIVQDVSWRQTKVKDYENNVHLIPNAVINSTTVQKVDPSFMVATMLSFTNDGRDLDAIIGEMEQLAKREIEKVAELEKDPWILLTQIGEYGTWAKMRFVLKDVSHAREARDAALRAVSPYTRNNAPDVLFDTGEED
ncbi:MAG: mechanosensitive ion channel [Eggerthellaceae bacterium]|nr:mechanosensitive ion channel [Eggerthellaceae bacterium]